ncbi:MAG: hypothetical protein OXR68_05260 [Alphaproteobacteria bacterium]|nr:hypothetical protein [Alphaproteobacteria bacterium]MDD9920012.1 hypothetical protein [Alphaproteobacteria bacterium]
MDRKCAYEEEAKVIDAIIAAMESQKMRPYRLAIKAGLTDTGTRHVLKKTNHPTLATCIMLADALDVKLSDLLRDVGL